MLGTELNYTVELVEQAEAKTWLQVSAKSTGKHLAMFLSFRYDGFC